MIHEAGRMIGEALTIMARSLATRFLKRVARPATA